MNKDRLTNEKIAIIAGDNKELKSALVALTACQNILDTVDEIKDIQSGKVQAEDIKTSEAITSPECNEKYLPLANKSLALKFIADEYLDNEKRDKKNDTLSFRTLGEGSIHGIKSECASILLETSDALSANKQPTLAYLAEDLASNTNFDPEKASRLTVSKFVNDAVNQHRDITFGLNMACQQMGDIDRWSDNEYWISNMSQCAKVINDANTNKSAPVLAPK